MASPSPRGLTPRPRRAFPWAWAAALAALALYARTLGFDWVYDDQMEVARNAFVTSLAYLPRVFTTTVWAGSGMETFLYRPLATATYALNHLVSGSAPWSYHLVNVLLHAGASALVVRLGTGWGLSRVGAGLAGLLFAVHPIHVEAVAPVFGRKDLLATFFLLGMLLAHRGALERAGWRQAAAPLLYLAAMLSKEVGVVGVALVVVQDLLLEQDRRAFLSRHRVPLLYASYLMAAAVYLAVRARVVGGLGIPDTSYFDNPLVSAPPGPRLATAWWVVAYGLGLHVLPLRQSPDYSFDAIPLVTSVGDPRFLAALGGTALLVVMLALPRLRRAPLPLATAWYALALLPVANLLLVSGTVFAERTLYLPSVAFCLAAGAVAARLVSWRSRVGWAVVAVVLVALSVQTLRYGAAWSDDVALFRHAVTAVPASTKAHHKLGEELLRRGELAPALRALHRALEIAPDNVWAAETLQVARSRVADRYLAAASSGAGFPQEAEVLYALGAVALERGDTVTAAEALRRFLAASDGLYPEEEEEARAALARLEGG